MISGDGRTGLELRSGPITRGDLTADVATFFLGSATPDAGILVGLEGELQATHLHRTFGAHLLGAVDLQERLAGRSHGEEQVGIGVLADGFIAPAVIGGTKGEG